MNLKKVIQEVAGFVGVIILLGLLFAAGFLFWELGRITTSVEERMRDTSTREIIGIYLSSERYNNDGGSPYTIYTIGDRRFSVADNSPQPQMIVGNVYKIRWHRIDGDYPFVFIEEATPYINEVSKSGG